MSTSNVTARKSLRGWAVEPSGWRGGRPSRTFRLLRTVAFITSLASAVCFAEEPGALALKAIAAADESCPSDGFDLAECEKAVALLSSALKLDPALSDVEVALAKAKWNLAFSKPKAAPERAALKEESVQLLRKSVERQTALAAATPDPKVRVSGARAMFELSVRTRDRTERLKTLERAATFDPKHGEVHRRLADEYLDRGELDKAVSSYGKGIEVRGTRDFGEGLEDVRFAQRLTDKGKTLEALKVLDKVLEVSADEPRSRRCMLFSSVDLKRFDALGASATAVAGKVKALRPHCVSFDHLNRAATFEKEGKVDEAIKELEEHQKKHPAEELGVTRLNDLYLRKGDETKATELNKKFFRLEVNPVEKCKQFRRLSPRAIRGLDKATSTSLIKDCVVP